MQPKTHQLRLCRLQRALRVSDSLGVAFRPLSRRSRGGTFTGASHENLSQLPLQQRDLRCGSLLSPLARPHNIPLSSDRVQPPCRTNDTRRASKSRTRRNNLYLAAMLRTQHKKLAEELLVLSRQGVYAACRGCGRTTSLRRRHTRAQPDDFILKQLYSLSAEAHRVLLRRFAGRSRTGNSRRRVPQHRGANLASANSTTTSRQAARMRGLHSGSLQVELADHNGFWVNGHAGNQRSLLLLHAPPRCLHPQLGKLGGLVASARELLQHSLPLGPGRVLRLQRLLQSSSTLLLELTRGLAQRPNFDQAPQKRLLNFVLPFDRQTWVDRKRETQATTSGNNNTMTTWEPT